MPKFRLTPAEPIVYAAAVAVGFMFVQMGTLGFQLGRQLSLRYSEGPYLLLAAGVVTVLVQIGYAYARGIGSEIKRVARSERWDLGLLLLLGVVCGLYVGKQALPAYQALFELIDESALVLAWGSTIVVPLAHALRSLNSRRVAAERSQLLDDKEIDSELEDVLGVTDQAVRFAQQVASTDGSVVFGIDAPWGTGKTSFVNLCAKHWRLAGRLVYRFEPLRYTEDGNLVDRFLSDLISEIQKNFFISELRPTLARYAKAIKGKAELGVPGAKLSIEGSTPTVDDVLDDLTLELTRAGAKIVVVVDDLDRIGPIAVKKVLFAVKKAFNLPNVTYVLCYDTEILVQTSSEKSDKAEAREFLEKFIGAKITLFVKTDRLVEYIRASDLAPVFPDPSYSQRNAASLTVERRARAA